MKCIRPLIHLRSQVWLKRLKRSQIDHTVAEWGGRQGVAAACAASSQTDIQIDHCCVHHCPQWRQHVWAKRLKCTTVVWNTGRYFAVSGARQQSLLSRHVAPAGRDVNMPCSLIRCANLQILIHINSMKESRKMGRRAWSQMVQPRSIQTKRFTATVRCHTPKCIIGVLNIAYNCYNTFPNPDVYYMFSWS